MNIELKFTPEGKEFYDYKFIPETYGSAGIDLIVTRKESIEISDDVIGTVVTGFKLFTGVSIYIRDRNVVGLVFPRSGNSIHLKNTIGVIDSDYQGEIILKVAPSSFNTEVGARVAQILFVPIIHPEFTLVEEFSEISARGSNGFGSTGK